MILAGIPVPVGSTQAVAQGDAGAPLHRMETKCDGLGVFYCPQMLVK